jgi:hypothetical protein
MKYFGLGWESEQDLNPVHADWRSNHAITLMGTLLKLLHAYTSRKPLVCLETSIYAQTRQTETHHRLTLTAPCFL